MLSDGDARALELCLAGGGVALFPADTVYGLGCDPELPDAVARLYAIKGRPAERPAAVMFFALRDALAALGEDLADVERDALLALMPGPVTVLLPNRHRRFPLACGPDPDTLGLRVPALGPMLVALAGMRRPLMQSSANESGAPDSSRVELISPVIRGAADLVLDAGPLPGVASTVIDLRALASGGGWEIVREGALPAADVDRVLGG
ncbi:MAG TPA: L-threonylcarbamoyladenylate synthase [Solirubrobacteraceae bacterium]|nr:L-threonylcarbamoyladenylate synthase [Solirubrobacteraceae bacterium]